ncbi:MAG: hypothetical protein PVSMB4_04840 [Ktedonobacterales bacterium]
MSDRDVENGGQLDVPPGDALLVYEGRRLALHGRTLKLILWVASRQRRINETAPEAGQLWMTWKGAGAHSIDGDIKAPL